MRAAGHMGADRVTVKNLTVVRVDAENNILVVKGSVPGAGGGYLRHPEGIGTMAEKAGTAKKKTADTAAAKQKAAAAAGQGAREGRAAKPRPRPKPAEEHARVARRAPVAVVNAEQQAGAATSSLHPEVFGVRVNEHLLYEAVKQYRAGAPPRART